MKNNVLFWVREQICNSSLAYINHRFSSRSVSSKNTEVKRLGRCAFFPIVENGWIMWANYDEF